ncbi:hypothetical protein CEXT_521681 [Caerostris extrusa]|uniref:Uncharacterized protein n=1 Tax=Caerostris extrusa TaxID=172846 RepID=A0AAV4SVM1_CAEEX|nr:hypothetical protein CEXT_521681 [Caerostris extrusa]
MMPNPVSPDDFRRKIICRSRIPTEQTIFLPKAAILGGPLIRSTLNYSDVPRTSHYFSRQPSRVFGGTSGKSSVAPEYRQSKRHSCQGTVLGGPLIMSTPNYSDVPRTSHYFSREPSRVFDGMVISPITLFRRVD